MIFSLLLVVTFCFAKTFSQSETPDGCFEIRFNSKLKCGQSVGSRSGIGEQQCLDLCLATPNCRALNYNGREGLCEMFSSGGLNIRGRNPPPNRSSGSGGGGFGRPPPGRRPPPGGRGGGGGRWRGGRGRVARQTLTSDSEDASSEEDEDSVQQDAVGGNSMVKQQVLQNDHGYRRRGPSPNYGRSSHGGGRSSHGGGRGGGGRGGNCGYRGPSVNSCQGVTYYKRQECGNREKPTTRAPITTRPPNPLPDGVVCPAGQEPRYLRLSGVELVGGDDFSIQNTNEQGCLDACTDNQLPDGTQAPCFSFEFDPDTGVCTLSLQRLPPQGTGGSRQTGNEKAYYEKICVDSALVVNCPDVFEQAPQTILVGFARAVTDANNYADCLDACLNAVARFGFTCRSGMYYYEAPSDNCLLNSEDSESQGDLIAEETIDVVTYFETRCIGTRARNAALQSDSIPTKPIIMKDTPEWGPFSQCDKQAGNQRRYKDCKSNNPNTCAKEIQDCTKSLGRSANPPKQTEENSNKRTVVSGKLTTNCIAPLKPRGGVDCSIGFKYVNGVRMSCVPVGCK